ncbi:unnamed protein product [Urochloa humidicola]
MVMSSIWMKRYSGSFNMVWVMAFLDAVRLYYKKIREEVTEDGKYSLVLVFEAKALELSDFEKRQAKFTSIFGPGIKAEIGKFYYFLYCSRILSSLYTLFHPFFQHYCTNAGKSGDDLYEVRLISEST